MSSRLVILCFTIASLVSVGAIALALWLHGLENAAVVFSNFATLAVLLVGLAWAWLTLRRL